MDIKPVLSYKGADSAGMFFCVMQLWYNSFVLHSALIPLYIHGNRCPNGSAIGNVNNVKSYIIMTRSLEGSNINVCLIVFPKENPDSFMIESLVIFQ